MSTHFELLNNDAGTRPHKNFNSITRVKWLSLNVARPSTRYRPTSTACDAKMGDGEMRRNVTTGRQAARVCVSTLRLTPADRTR